MFKNIQFRFAKPNVSSKIVGWLVAAWNGKILGLKNYAKKEEQNPE